MSKYKPVRYADLQRGQMFTIHGSRKLYIKHSNAVCFDEEGKDTILALNDPCYPKVVDRGIYHKFFRYVLRQDFDTKARNETPRAQS